MIGRDVEHLEVGQIVLDLGSLVDAEPEPAEDVGDPAHRLDERVEGTPSHRPAGRGHVDRLGRQPAGQLAGSEGRAPFGQGRLDRGPDLVGDRANPGPILGRQAPDPAQDAGQRALLAEDLDLERVEGRAVGSGRNRRQRVVAQLLELRGEAGQVQGSVPMAKARSRV
jgi:hypothetical protein